MQELNKAGGEANVYKLIGPALVVQDMVEATSNVNKRLDYIKGEIDRLNKQHASLEDKGKNKEQDVRGDGDAVALLMSSLLVVDLHPHARHRQYCFVIACCEIKFAASGSIVIAATCLSALLSDGNVEC